MGKNSYDCQTNLLQKHMQIKKNKELRDLEGTLVYPIIYIERTATTKDPMQKDKEAKNKRHKIEDQDKRLKTEETRQNLSETNLRPS